MDRELIKKLKTLCLELKEQEQEAKQLEEERPEHKGYFFGLSIGRMQARIELEILLEQRPTSTTFSPPSRSAVIDGDCKVKPEIPELGYFKDGALVEGASSHVDDVLTLAKETIEANITGSSLMLQPKPGALGVVGLVKVINLIESLGYYVYYPSVSDKEFVEAFNDGKILESELDERHLETFLMDGKLIYGPSENPERQFRFAVMKYPV